MAGGPLGLGFGECEPAWGNLVGFFRNLPPQRWTGETRGPLLGRRTFSPDFGGRVAVMQPRLCYSSSLNTCHVQGCFDAEKFLFPPQTCPPFPETWGFPKREEETCWFPPKSSWPTMASHVRAQSMFLHWTRRA